MNRTPFEKVGDFLLGRGFYVVLFLCVATIGFSGYYLINSFTPTSTGEIITPTNAAPEIIIPDPVTPTTTPIPSITITPAQVETVDPQEINEVVAPATVTVETVNTPTVTAPAVYTWPVQGAILRDFSVDVLLPDNTMGDWRTHDGLDIASSLGTSVLAPSDGTVTAIYEDDLMGTTLVIDHGHAVVSTLCNLSPVVVVKVGDAVTTGMVVGAVGETAISESAMEPHLHISMTVDGVSVNPIDYLPQ